MGGDPQNGRRDAVGSRNVREPVAGMLARWVANLLLAYGCAALTTIAAILYMQLVDPPVDGPGPAGSWAVTMGTLLFGAPAVLIYLGVVDYFLKRSRRPRRSAILAFVAPAVLPLILVPAYPDFLGYAAWMLGTGAFVGAILRLPPSAGVGAK